MMTYEETIGYLFTQLPVYQNEGGKAYKPGLERVERLLELCGQPHKELKALHIGGTNGKGSTASMLAAVLQAAGYRVGLFTSPHLVDFRERIRVNGEMVSEEYVVRFVEELRPEIPEGLSPSFFELTTAMAFAYFQEQEVDLAVVEVGMGGRLDSTNVLSPMVSVITNVSIDHATFLGGTLREIAFEKAGIIKAKTPIVLGRSQECDVLEVVEQRAREVGAPLVLADRSREVLMYQLLPEGGIRYTTRHYGTFVSPLSGGHQVENMRTVLATLGELNKLGIEVSATSLKKGLLHLKDVGLRGRLEVLQAERPRVVLDTGHNAGAWEYLAEQLETWQNSGGLVIVLGMAADKEVEEVLRLLPCEALLVLCKAKGQRSMSATELAEHAKKVGLEQIEVIPEVLTAYQTALRRCEERGAETLFVGGSNFVVGELLAELAE